MRLRDDLQSESESFSAPVFVDDSGRRHRRFRLSARGGAAVFATYLALTIAGFTGHGPLAGIRLPFLAPARDASAHATAGEHHDGPAGVTDQSLSEPGTATNTADAGTPESSGTLDPTASGSDASARADEPVGSAHSPDDVDEPPSSPVTTVPGDPSDPSPPVIDPPPTPTTNPAGDPIANGNPTHGPDKSQGNGAANGKGGTEYTPGVPNDNVNQNAAGNAKT